MMSSVKYGLNGKKIGHKHINGLKTTKNNGET